MWLDSVKIENYRNIKDLSIDSFAPITLLVGRNNTGKSGFLETISLISTSENYWGDSLNRDVIKLILSKRGGIDNSDLMINVNAKTASIEGKGELVSGKISFLKDIGEMPQDIRNDFITHIENYAKNQVSRSIDRIPRSIYEEAERPFDLERESNALVMSILRNIKILIIYESNNLGEESSWICIVNSNVMNRLRNITDRRMLDRIDVIRSFSPTKSRTIYHTGPLDSNLKNFQKELKRSGYLLDVLDVMREKIQNFKDIREEGDDLLIYSSNMRKPMPLESMGDGFKAQLSILYAIATLNEGIVIMEEPEVRLHPGYMHNIVEQINIAATKHNIQFFISTHSIEFLEYMLKKCKERINVIRMYSIIDKPEIDYEVLTGDEALEEIEELKLDLRGG